MTKEGAIEMPQSLEPTLTRAEIRPTMSPEQMDEYLQRPGNVRWFEAGELLREECDACIDGRTKEPVVGNPGGDLAILTEVAIAVANERQKPLEQTEFQSMMEWWLEEFGTFYLHTDEEHGIDPLKDSLNADEIVARERGKKFETNQEVVDFITQPDLKLQMRLLGHLLNPDNIGCGHLKQMLIDASAYGVSRKVINGLSQAYFELRWNGNDEQKKKLSYPVLSGRHEEKGIVVINFLEDVTESTKVPMIRPMDGKDSVFVAHPQVTHFMQEQVARKLVRSDVLSRMNEGMEINMLAQMKKMHLKETQTTSSRLGWGLPIFQYNVK